MGTADKAVLLKRHHMDRHGLETLSQVIKHVSTQSVIMSMVMRNIGDLLWLCYYSLNL